MARSELPEDYVEKVYAGALGKVIGVYLGRPFESWSYERITRELGEIHYYVHDKLGVPLVVPDDDIAGTFTFLRALPDSGGGISITAEQIGQTWLNYLIEGRTILWWGGLGNSTEHTAFLRLRSGVPAPASGSMQLNGKVVAEQIGAQIFVDGWAMVAAGRPALAATLAERAASVSHDGEALHAARLLAAMEASAFVERDIDKLLEVGLSLVPADSTVSRMVHDIRGWHADQPADWRQAFRRLADLYGYDAYGGNCHVIPNHGLIILALLYGEGQWDRSMMIVNTCGWDTDCNSGNLGALLGIRNGLAAFEGSADWRGPVADRIYLSSADGGRAITDVATEALRVANLGRGLLGLEELRPKNGARFHFELPGSVQGFRAIDGAGIVANVVGHSQTGSRSLSIQLPANSVAEVLSPTFIPIEAIDIDHVASYDLLASPTLYAGQRLSARLSSDGHLSCSLRIRHYDGKDQVVAVDAPDRTLSLDGQEISWSIPSTGGQPIESVGLLLTNSGAEDATAYLDYLTWDGAPNTTLSRPADGGSMWRRAWVDNLDNFNPIWPESYRLIKNSGQGMLIQGTEHWRDFRLSAVATPHLAASAGVAVRVQGLRRYYAVVLSDGWARLVKIRDEHEEVLAETSYAWELGRPYSLQIQVSGDRIDCTIDETTLSAIDRDQPLMSGGIGLLCEEGCAGVEDVAVAPLSPGQASIDV